MQRLTEHLRTCVNMCVKDCVSFFQIQQSSECLVALPLLPVLFPNNHQTFRLQTLCVKFVVCVCVCLCVCYSLCEYVCVCVCVCV